MKFGRFFVKIQEIQKIQVYFKIFKKCKYLL